VERFCENKTPIMEMVQAVTIQKQYNTVYVNIKRFSNLTTPHRTTPVGRSIVGIATCYGLGWTVRGSNHGTGEIFQGPGAHPGSYAMGLSGGKAASA
jgi:hypothetical protein